MAAATRKDREFSFTDKDFAYISKRVGETVGIVLTDAKKDMVYSRIARRLRALGMTKTTEYISYLEGPDGHTEITDFVNAVTTNLTRFFREGHHFEHIGDQFGKVKENQQFRIWSAGCSSGMEAYSIAMTARSKISQIDSVDFKILATDIDTNMLKTGSKGLYRKRDVEIVDPSLQRRYICKVKGDDDAAQMNDNLRKLVFFKELNLLNKWPMRGKFDIIFCRNVVIYFDKDTQAVLFDRFADQLQDGGLLYIGHSESLHNVCDRFELLGQTIYRKIS